MSQILHIINNQSKSQNILGKTHLHSDSTQINSRKSILEKYGYKIGNKIGTGTFSIIKKAWSEAHNDRVAIKIICKYNTAKEYFQKFLPNNIEIVKELKHPNVVRFIQAIETTHRIYIVMELVENINLMEVIKKEGHIDETRARKWFNQLCFAVNYMHERNLGGRCKDTTTYWFREIKCENILMDADNNIKLSDFGFGKPNSKLPIGHYILCETQGENYAYLPPEVLRGVPYVPELADVWSCGVVLYMMVIGELPFDDSDFYILYKLVHQKVAFPNEPKISEGCRNVIMQVLGPLKQRPPFKKLMDEPWCTGTNEENKSVQLDDITTQLNTIENIPGCSK